MAYIKPFESSELEAVCKVLGDTDNGLTGSEIAYFMQEVKLTDTDPALTKWKRLYNALAHSQNHNQAGNHLILYINAAMRPARYINKRDKFEWLRHNLNIALAFSGYQVREDGRVAGASKVTTLKEAEQRAGRLKSILETRGTHSEIYKYCRAELLADNYFHAVFEACKGLSRRIQNISGLTTDGAELVNTAFSTKAPLVFVNALQTETEVSEHKGIANLLVGLFGAVRNPLAHAPKVLWDLPEQDAVDILALVSFIHRKLDVQHPST